MIERYIEKEHAKFTGGEHYTIVKFYTMDAKQQKDMLSKYKDKSDEIVYIIGAYSEGIIPFATKSIYLKISFDTFLEYRISKDILDITRNSEKCKKDVLSEKINITISKAYYKKIYEYWDRIYSVYDIVKM